MDKPDVRVERPDAPRDVVSQQGPPPCGKGARIKERNCQENGRTCQRCGQWHSGYNLSDQPTAFCEACYPIVGEQSAVELQMERCAALKGYAGKLRAHVHMAHEALTDYGDQQKALYHLSRALEIPAPENPS